MTKRISAKEQTCRMRMLYNGKEIFANCTSKREQMSKIYKNSRANAKYKKREIN